MFITRHNYLMMCCAVDVPWGQVCLSYFLYTCINSSITAFRLISCVWMVLCDGLFTSHIRHHSSPITLQWLNPPSGQPSLHSLLSCSSPQANHSNLCSHVTDRGAGRWNSLWNIHRPERDDSSTATDLHRHTLARRQKHKNTHSGSRCATVGETILHL